MGVLFKKIGLIMGKLGFMPLCLSTHASIGLCLHAIRVKADFFPFIRSIFSRVKYG